MSEGLSQPFEVRNAGGVDVSPTVFVLDPVNDPAARDALTLYAERLLTNPDRSRAQLAYDLIEALVRCDEGGRFYV